MKQKLLFANQPSSPNTQANLLKYLMPPVVLVVLLLQGCASNQATDPKGHQPPDGEEIGLIDITIKKPFDYHQANPKATNIQMASSRWVPAAWADLPGWNQDSVKEAWQAWINSCTVSSPIWEQKCKEILMLASASESVKRQWMYNNLQPYRVESLKGKAAGLLTAYYEPIFRARRVAMGEFQYPLYKVPANLPASTPYWSRKELESNPKVLKDMQDYRFAYLADPLDVLILHIQGSGQLIITEENGETHTIRAAYGANNNHRYASVGKYLLDRKLLTDATWPGIKTWLNANPKRVNEVLWSNPRYIFFREESMQDPAQGPLGAQGVPLSYGRSIAVDKTSIPYGTPVWMASTDSTQTTPPIQKLVLAQDTGAAIVGAVRADYFWGKGPSAGEQAGRTKQPLYLWTFLPR